MKNISLKLGLVFFVLINISLAQNPRLLFQDLNAMREKFNNSSLVFPLDYFKADIQNDHWRTDDATAKYSEDYDKDRSKANYAKVLATRYALDVSAGIVFGDRAYYWLYERQTNYVTDPSYDRWMTNGLALIDYCIAYDLLAGSGYFDYRAQQTGIPASTLKTNVLNILYNKATALYNHVKKPWTVGELLGSLVMQKCESCKLGWPFNWTWRVCWPVKSSSYDENVEQAHFHMEIGNIRIIVASALGVAGYLMKDDLAYNSNTANWLNFAKTDVEQFLLARNKYAPVADGYGNVLTVGTQNIEGFYPEGVSYLNYASEGFIPFIIANKVNGDGDYSQDVNFRKILDWYCDVQKPSGAGPELNSSYNYNNYPFSALFASPPPYVDNYLSQLLTYKNTAGGGNSIPGFNFPVEGFCILNNSVTSLPRQFPPLLVKSTQGQAIYRYPSSSPIKYFLFSAPDSLARANAGTHGHAEAGSFIFVDGGKTLIRHPGYSGHPNSEDYEKAISHSTICPIVNSTIRYDATVRGVGLPPCTDVKILKSKNTNDFTYLHESFELNESRLGTEDLINNVLGIAMFENSYNFEITNSSWIRSKVNRVNYGNCNRRFLMVNNSVDNNSYLIVLDEIIKTSDSLQYAVSLIQGNNGDQSESSWGTDTVRTGNGDEVCWNHGAGPFLRVNTAALGGKIIEQSGFAKAAHENTGDLNRAYHAMYKTACPINYCYGQILSILESDQSTSNKSSLVTKRNNDASDYLLYTVDGRGRPYGRYDVVLSRKECCMQSYSIVDLPFPIITDAKFLIMSFSSNLQDLSAIKILSIGATLISYNGVSLTPDNVDETNAVQYPSTPPVTFNCQSDAGTESGTLSYQNPWVTDIYGNHPFNSINSGSIAKVFLNQSGPPLWNPPYFTVCAPATLVINGETCSFSKWCGTGVVYQDPTALQTGVAFQSANAAVNAFYKKHLVSNNPVPTRGNGQQRIASTNRTGESYGEDIVVYNSMEEIWTSTRNRNTNTWTPEVRLSDGLGGNSDPSVAARGTCMTSGLFGDGIYVVWQKLRDDGNYDVYFAMRNFWTTNYGNTTPGGTPIVGWITRSPSSGLPMKVNTTPCTVPPKPVVTIHQPLTDYYTIELIPVVYRQNPSTIMRRYTLITSYGLYDGWFYPNPALPLTASTIWPPISGVESGSLCLSQPEIEYDNGKTVTLAYVDVAPDCNFSLKTVEQTSNAFSPEGNRFVWLTPKTVPASDGRTPLHNDPYSWYGELCGTLGIYSPQVIRRIGRTCYAWIEVQTYEDPIVPFIVYQELSSDGVWSNAWVLDLLNWPNWNLRPSSVSLGQDYGSYLYQNIFNLLWSVENTSYKAEKLNGSGWQLTTLPSNGYDPQMTYFGSSPYGTYSDLFLYLSTESGPSFKQLKTPAMTPYAKATTAESSGILPLEKNQNASRGAKGTVINCRYSRVLTVMDTVQGTRLTITVSQPKLGNRTLSFNPVNDTLPDINASNCLQYLSSLPATIGDTDDTLSFAIGIQSKNLKKSLQPLTCDLTDQRTSVKITSLASLSGDGKKDNNRSCIKVPVQRYKGNEVKMLLNGIDFSALGKNLQFILMHVYKPEKPDSVQEKKAGDEMQVQPRTNALLDNYPNPFNPTTALSYQLSAVSKVTLKVYDLLGREVAVLVDEVKGAGTYTTHFDGSKLASGIYFARFVAQAQGESQPFVQVKKMLLTK